MQIMLKANVLPAESLETIERQYADLGIFECHSLARILVVADAIDADDLAGHMVTGDLILRVLGKRDCLERTGPDRV